MHLDPLKSIQENSTQINPESGGQGLSKSVMRRRRSKILMEARLQKNQIQFEQNISRMFWNEKLSSLKGQSLPIKKFSPISQIKEPQNHKSLKLPEDKQYQECQICFADFKKNQLLSISNCNHKYCSQCLKGHLRNQIKLQKIALCPDKDCKQRIDAFSPFLKNLTLTQQQKYYNIQVYYNLSQNQTLKICPTQNCQGFIDIKQKTIICPICSIQFCQKCLLNKHKGLCDENTGLFLQNNYNFRRCQKCKMILQKNNGCNHMTCKCGHQFCYICGKQWLNNHKCSQPQKMVIVPPDPNRPTIPMRPPISLLRQEIINIPISDPASNAQFRVEKPNILFRNQQVKRSLQIEIPNNNNQIALERQVINVQIQQNDQWHNIVWASIRNELQQMLYYSIRIIAFVFIIAFLCSLYLPTNLLLFLAQRLRSGFLKFATYSWKQKLLFNIFLYIYCIASQVPSNCDHKQCFGVFSAFLIDVVKQPMQWIFANRQSQQNR